MRIIAILIFAASILSCSTNAEDQGVTPLTKGVYGNPGTLLEAGYSFDSLGMNAVFVRSVSLNREFFDNAKSQGCKVYVEFPTLLGRNYLQDNPEAWPINEKGEEAAIADWFMGICPTDTGFREYREGQLREILNSYDVDGIFLDYVHWHAQFETADPILPETCFCSRCTEIFQENAGLQLTHNETEEKAGWILANAENEWRKWRNSILNGWVSGLSDIVKEHNSDILVGVFYCSWYPEDHNSALYRILGIDVKSLAGLADVLSPMLFHKMKDRPPEWVGEYIEWLDNYTKAGDKGSPLIWPIVQSHNNPEVVTPAEFRQVMLEGTKAPVTGIMMFSDQSLLEDPEKIRVMKELYMEVLN